MPPEYEPTTFGSFGFIGEDGITWTPVGKVEEQELTVSTNQSEPSYRELMADDFGTLKMEKLYVSRKTFKWLRKLLGYTRLDYVWAYRHERKGHPRCR